MKCSELVNELLDSMMTYGDLPIEVKIIQDNVNIEVILTGTGHHKNGNETFVLFCAE
ncbi:hypothetical protein [Methanobrevibacter sp. DSM 116169]|uniref:hypothetical protein n=1 Tax=Methanobrevibacter sp. DSM 116169 TaxID=3242727 RepID=UPI0038FD0DB4